MKILIVDVYNDGHDLRCFMHAPGISNVISGWRKHDRRFVQAMSSGMTPAREHVPFSVWMSERGYPVLEHTVVDL